MTQPLLSDDLATVLSVFPQDLLGEIVTVLKGNKSFTPFPMPIANKARKAVADENLTDHAEEIAREILWWGSNEITRQLGRSPNWRDLLISIGTALGVTEADLALDRPIYTVEGAILRTALPDWEVLNREQRAAKLREAGMRGKSAIGLIGSIPALAINVASRLGFAAGAEAAGGAAAAAGGTAAAGTGIAAVMATAAPVVAALAAVAGTGYTIFELSGPAYRVIRPVVLLVAYTRQRLRDERNADAFVI